jgi:hypothetical protein
MTRIVKPDIAEARAKFLSHWTALYPETLPISYLFKHRLRTCWARSRSLPDAKRCAETKAEWDILLHRQNTIIDSLIEQGASIRIVINQIASDNYLFKSFNLEDIGVFLDQDSEAAFHCYQFETTWESHTLNPLLSMIAFEDMRAFIMAPDCLIAPYGGGMDIIFKDPHTCWAFKRQFKDWISKRPDGL